MTNIEVATIIGQQLGGLGRLRAMTGATNIYANSEQCGGLSMKLGSGARNRDGKAVTHLKVVLTASDTYEVTTYFIRGTNVRTVETNEDVYADELMNSFERLTGFYLTLVRRAS